MAEQSLNQNFDVIFVSSFGRHNWIARELARNEWRVGHIDVSRILGEWREDDVRNPFGLCQTPELKDEQFEYWKSLTHAQKISSGVSILFSRGPFEGSGPLREFFQTQQKVPRDVIHYLKASSANGSVKKDLKRQSLKLAKFDQNWLLNLSQQMGSTIFSDNANAKSLDNAFPIFSECYRDCSNSEMRRSAKFLGDLASVASFEATHLSSVEKASDGSFELTATALRAEVDSQDANGMKHLQKSASHQVLRTRVLIWGLTSAETDYLSHECAKFLFPKKILEPSWSWQRFLYKGPKDILELWPIQFYMLEHLRLPWTHDNLALLSKKETETFDVWMRIPGIFRFNGKYISELAAQFQRKLSDKFVSEEFELVDLPIEAKLKKEQLGPPRWPIYMREDVENLGPLKKPYLIFDSFEQHKTYQVQAQLSFQENLFNELTQLRREWLAVEAKAKQKSINREIRKRE